MSDHNDHPPYLGHHYDTAEQQFDSGKLGMWLFLATEILLFAGLFCAYAIYRKNHPEIFLYAHQFLDKELGGINTLVLITSSFTMAMAVRSAQLGKRSVTAGLLALTLLGGVGFLGIKAIEYEHKWKYGLLWGTKYEDQDVHHGGSHDEHGAASGEHGAVSGAPGAVPGAPGTASGEPAAAGTVPASSASAVGGAALGDTAIAAGGAGSPTSPNGALPVGGAGGEPDTAGGAGVSVPVSGAPPGNGGASAAAGADGMLAGPGGEGDASAGPVVMIGGEAMPRSQLSSGAQPPQGLVVPAEGEAAGGHAVPKKPSNVHIFFGIYFLMTGLHGLHVIAGMAAIAWVLVRTLRGDFSTQYSTPVDLVGLYWHLVDLVWIYLFPLLYLIH